MTDRFDSSAAGDREFCFLFEVENCDNTIEVKVNSGKLAIALIDKVNMENYDLIFSSDSSVFDRIIDSYDELTGVDAYFAGDLELTGDRNYLEDLFEVFGIV